MEAGVPRHAGDSQRFEQTWPRVSSMVMPVTFCTILEHMEVAAPL
jgi:hypothetical protein